MTTNEPLSRPDTWQAGDQVTRTYTRDEEGVWSYDGYQGLVSDRYINIDIERGHLTVSHLSPRTDGASKSTHSPNCGVTRCAACDREDDERTDAEDGPRCSICGDDDPSGCERHGRCCDDCHDADPVTPAPVGDMDAAEVLASIRVLLDGVRCSDRDVDGNDRCGRRAVAVPWGTLYSKDQVGPKCAEHLEARHSHLGMRVPGPLSGPSAVLYLDDLHRLVGFAPQACTCGAVEYGDMTQHLIPCPLAPRPAPVARSCDVCGKAATHVTTPGGMRGCDGHFGGRS